MSLLESLRPKRGSTGYRKRVGRGVGSGLGQTSGKGHKGQRARAGGRVRWGFEGGQTPLMRRLPKFGFSNVDFANRFDIVNVGQLEAFDKEVNPSVLVKAGYAHKNAQIKVLAQGELKKALIVKAHKFSDAAKLAIEKAGGKAEVIS